MKHGNESYLIKGEGLVVGRLFPLSLLRWIFSTFHKFVPDAPDPAPHPGNSDDDDSVTPPTRLFCRLFEKGEQPDGESLIELGQLMETESGDPEDERDSNIPAGYTYLGQFIDHDITLDRETPLNPIDIVEPGDVTNFRTPALDLDSVYLDGPDKNSELYEADGKSFKIGQTSDVMNLGVFNNDLPRNGTTANIGEGRNDENLIIAQTHLAFLKFHNSRVAANPAASFKDIRREVVLHYQSIILTDFLPRVIDKSVLDDVLKNGRQFYTDADEFKNCMPIEFSVAAYRMGHSMIRPSYEWNNIFNSDGPLGIATFGQIFEFSGVSGTRGAGDPPFRGLPTLPSNWIADWRRMYDFSEAGGETHEQLNFARKLDARMTIDLKTLPEFQQMNPPPPAPLLSLATRNLLRGRLVSQATGQQVAIAMGETPLTPIEIISNVDPDQAQVLVEKGFDQETPLWYYILREAMVQADGNHLGAVGSRIVAETFVGLIKNSSTNLLSEQSDLRFSMPEMLMSVPENVNPLG
ncbi:MAG: heme peroxidase family protein [Methylococcales bacterium]